MKKGLEIIKEFVIDELEEYSYFKYKDIKFDEEYPDGEFYYIVTIKTIDNKEKELRFKYESDEGKILIELSEDNYDELTSYNYTVKYFWMALLKWEI